MPTITRLSFKDFAADESLRRAFFVCVPALACVAFMFAVHALEGEWTWMQSFGRHFASQASVEYLPIPVAFFLWFSLMDRQEKFQLAFSPLYLALMLLCFIEMEQMSSRPGGFNTHQMLFGEVVLLALLAFVPPEQVLPRVWRDKTAAFCAAVAASSVCDYYWLMNHRWSEMTAASAQVSYAIMQVFGLDATIELVPQWQRSIAIHSSSFNVTVTANCNGFEGIFLFLFLLSVLLLFDWESFNRRRIPLYYAAGIAYMFMVNCLRIVSFFSLGYWAYKPDAPAWLQSLRDTPVYLFHSYVGWVYYILAFELFSRVIYHRKRKATALNALPKN